MPALLLGDIQRLVCTLDDVFHAGVAPIKLRHAQTQRRRAAACGIGAQGLAAQLQQLLCKRGHLDHGGMAQNGKFIAPHTAHQILRPRHLQQGLGQIAQRLIPGNMALLVIDGLEMVHIHAQQADGGHLPGDEIRIGARQ